MDEQSKGEEKRDVMGGPLQAALLAPSPAAAHCGAHTGLLAGHAQMSNFDRHRRFCHSARMFCSCLGLFAYPERAPGLVVSILVRLCVLSGAAGWHRTSISARRLVTVQKRSASNTILARPHARDLSWSFGCTKESLPLDIMKRDKLTSWATAAISGRHLL